MNKIKLNKDLSLSKKVLANLQNEEMSSLRGGQGVMVQGSDGQNCSCDKKSCYNNKVQK